MTVNNALGFDVGEKRIGIARVNMIARLPQPIKTIQNNATLISQIASLIDENSPDVLIVGLPRNLNGEETAQTLYVKTFAHRNLSQFNIPIIYQDETLSSVAAEERLQGSAYHKSDIDAHAAVIILEDYIRTI